MFCEQKVIFVTGLMWVTFLQRSDSANAATEARAG
jgi:hypothetical protein